MTVKYGLLGHPLGHSFSRGFHNGRFEKFHIDAVYENYDLDDISMFPDVLRQEANLCGLNVTIPYKQAVMQYLDELDPVASRIGAVNTIKVLRGEEYVDTKTPGFYLIGYNTDIIGFRDSIAPMLTGARRALLLGTGGASKAVKVALEDAGIKVTYVSRTPAPDRLTYADLNEDIMIHTQVIVNCSPVGMYPHVDECPDIPYQFINNGHVCYDLIYNPSETLFLKKASENGARIMSGGAMLEGQALAAYKIWTT